jgi:ribonuclease BN (tRNA processing enzyme)
MLTILGGGGWFPAYDRQTACALLRHRDSAIMIDAGTGAGRLVERPELLDGVERLDIVLTHDLGPG